MTKLCEVTVVDAMALKAILTLPPRNARCRDSNPALTISS
jgi:hypothetical protein